MTSTSISRQAFITSATQFLRERNFDGLDIDWEFPAMRGGNPQDKANLVALLSVKYFITIGKATYII